MSVPVEGMPGERPRCAYCCRALKYWTNDTRSPGPPPTRLVRRVFQCWRGYPVREPIFDNLRCALAFAIASHRAGFRVKP